MTGEDRRTWVDLLIIENEERAQRIAKAKARYDGMDFQIQKLREGRGVDQLNKVLDRFQSIMEEL